MTTFNKATYWRHAAGVNVVTNRQAVEEPVNLEYFTEASLQDPR